MCKSLSKGCDKKVSINNVISIIFCGVGGQGILLASEVMAEVALAAGLDVKKSEIHGMAQRGGSVFSHVRFGKKVYSPVVPLGSGDYLVSFEELEALRYSPYLKRDAFIIVNTQKINPITVLAKEASYPEDCIGMLKKEFKNVIPIDALSKAQEAGSFRAVNSVIIGALSKMLSFDKALWLDVLIKKVPKKAKEANVKAFLLGRDLL